MKEIVKKQNLLAVLEKHLLNIVKEAGEEFGKEAHDSTYIYENKLGKVLLMMLYMLIAKI